MQKPEGYLQSVWDKLSEEQKKETYLNSIIYSFTAPPYLAGAITNADTTIDNKINIAEKILNNETLTEHEKKLIGLQIAD